MSKRNIVFILLLLLFSKIYADDILLAPIVLYNQDNEKITQLQNPNKQLMSILNTYWFNGLLDFKLLTEAENGYVYGILDAERICATKEMNFLIYGYIKKDDTSWFGNLKLYSSKEKKIIKEFFASDDINSYDRFIETMVNNIINYCETLVSADISKKNKDTKRPLEINLPMTLSYWTPTSYGWNDVLTGIIGTNFNVEIFPPTKEWIVNSVKIDYAAQVRIGYSFGIGNANRYPLFYKSILIGLPIISYYHISDLHSLYFGTGFYCDMEIMTVQPKYEEKKTIYQTMLGFQAIAGYQLTINDKTSLFTEIEVDFNFGSSGYIIFRPILGVKLNAYKKQM